MTDYRCVERGEPQKRAARRAAIMRAKERERAQWWLMKNEQWARENEREDNENRSNK